MQGKPRREWPVVKALMSLAIRFFIGRGTLEDPCYPS